MVQLLQNIDLSLFHTFGSAEGGQWNVLYCNLAFSFRVPPLVDFSKVSASEAAVTIVGESGGDFEIVV